MDSDDEPLAVQSLKSSSTQDEGSIGQVAAGAKRAQGDSHSNNGSAARKADPNMCADMCNGMCADMCAETCIQTCVQTRVRHVPWTVGTVSTRAFKWYMAHVCRVSICLYACLCTCLLRMHRTAARKANPSMQWCPAGSSCTGKLDKSCALRHRDIKKPRSSKDGDSNEPSKASKASKRASNAARDELGGPSKRAKGDGNGNVAAKRGLATRDDWHSEAAKDYAKHRSTDDSEKACSEPGIVDALPAHSPAPSKPAKGTSDSKAARSSKHAADDAASTKDDARNKDAAAIKKDGASKTDDGNKKDDSSKMAAPLKRMKAGCERNAMAECSEKHDGHASGEKHLSPDEQEACLLPAPSASNTLIIDVEHDPNDPFGLDAFLPLSRCGCCLTSKGHRQRLPRRPWR